MKKYIAVAGNVGAGKTSLVEFLTKRYKLKPFYEPNDKNPYLADFYKDMRRWAFQSQVYFLTHKLRRDLRQEPPPLPLHQQARLRHLPRALRDYPARPHPSRRDDFPALLRPHHA